MPVVTVDHWFGPSGPWDRRPLSPTIAMTAAALGRPNKGGDHMVPCFSPRQPWEEEKKKKKEKEKEKKREKKKKKKNNIIIINRIFSSLFREEKEEKKY